MPPSVASIRMCGLNVKHRVVGMDFRDSTYFYFDTVLFMDFGIERFYLQNTVQLKGHQVTPLNQ